MKNVTLTVDGEHVSLCCGKKSNTNQVQYGTACRLSAIKKLSARNVILVSEQVFDDFRNCRAILFNPQNKSFFDVTLKKSAELSGNDIAVTKATKEKLSLKLQEELLLLKNKSYIFNNIDTQRIENIREDSVVVSALDGNGVEVDVDGFLYFQFFNYYTNESIVLKCNHVKVDKALKQGTILLNQKQRTFLELENRLAIPAQHWQEIIANVEEKDKETLASMYMDDSSHFILKSDVSYHDKLKAQEIIHKACPKRLLMTAVVQSYCQKKSTGLRALADFYVGRASMSLLCRRPYESDEGANVVRLSASNMHLLGLTETDKVVLRYKNKTVKCRVLPIDDEHAFENTNLPTSVNYAVGIPAHIRQKLGIFQLNTAVKVERDTVFLLKKSLNEQVVPTLLTLFSVSFIQNLNIWQKLLIAVLAIPVVVYINLSSKRNMRG